MTGALSTHEIAARLAADIPTGSYEEMGEWALPPDESLLFHAILKDAKARDLPEARWLRGAFWRNFQVKYREINDLHKQMLRTSDAVAWMAAGSAHDAALRELMQGQSNRLCGCRLQLDLGAR